MWARRDFPEPAEGTGAAAFQIQSRALDVPLLLPFPFQKIEEKKQNKTKAQTMPAKKVQHMFRNTGRGKWE